MAKRERLLDQITEARNDEWLGTMGGLLPPASRARLANPDRRLLKRLSDEELTELIAREPDSKLGRLADSVLRGRDSWRTPAKWALLVSICSFVLAAVALARTF